MISACQIASAAGLLFLAGSVAWAETPPAAPPKSEGPAVKSVSGPFTHGNLTVFLLHGGDVMPGKSILTLQEALEQKKAVVHETSNVNELSVENLSDEPLFIQSGDIVKGGKQDRAIAFDMLLPPKSGKVAIGSFCVEHGRWRQRGQEAAGSFAGSTTQIAGKDLKAAVVGNSSERQGEVWKEVGNTQEKLSRNAATQVMSPASPSSLQLSLENKQVLEKLSAYEKAISGAVDGKSDVIGMALCINGQVQGAEVYGSSALFRKLWPKLLKSAATEALGEVDEKKKFDPATAKAVEAFLKEAAAAPAKEVAMAGGRGQSAANQAGQRGGIRSVSPASDANATPTRVKIVRYDGTKAVLVESRDKEAANAAVLHQCYIAK
jgi:hypothetical protein